MQPRHALHQRYSARILHRFRAICGTLSVLLVGCSHMGFDVAALQGDLVGIWKSTDLTAHEHVTDFAEMTITIASNGLYRITLVDHEGRQTTPQEGRCSVSGSRLSFGAQNEYRFAVNAMQLVLVREWKGRAGPRLVFERMSAAGADAVRRR